METQSTRKIEKEGDEYNELGLKKAEMGWRVLLLLVDLPMIMYMYWNS